MSKRAEHVVSLEVADVAPWRPRFFKVKKRIVAHNNEEAEQSARSLIRAENPSVRVVAVKNILRIEEDKVTQ